MTIDELKTLQASGEFHHATYRNQNSLWEGLHIYRKSETGFRGFEHVGAFLKNNPDLQQAESLCTGVSVGSYGRG